MSVSTNWAGSPTGDLEIKLHPGATITGRVVDSAGQPLENALINNLSNRMNSSEKGAAGAVPGVLLTYLDDHFVKTDKRGRFELPGIIPGLKYSASARGPSARGGIPIFKDVTAEAGETKDLGDVQIAAANTKSAAASPANKDKVEVRTIRGRVVLPDGRPAVSARLSLLRFHWKSRGVVPWEQVANTAANETGGFHDCRRPPDDSQDGLGLLVATAPGYGFECVQCGERQASHPIEVKLARPTRAGPHCRFGGEAVAGARVRVAAIYDSLRGDLGPWLAAMKSGVQRYSTAAHTLLGTYRSGIPSTAVSRQPTATDASRWRDWGPSASSTWRSSRTTALLVIPSPRGTCNRLRPRFIPTTRGGSKSSGPSSRNRRNQRGLSSAWCGISGEKAVAGVSVES